MIHAVENTQAEASATTDPANISMRKSEFDYLRAFAVILVLCHHAILAYTRYAFINPENPMVSSKPGELPEWT